jgi:hypothetical protein
MVVGEYSGHHREFCQEGATYVVVLHKWMVISPTKTGEQSSLRQPLMLEADVHKKYHCQIISAITPIVET